MNKLIAIQSDYSIQSSFIKIDDLINFAINKKYPYLCIADTHSVSGIPEFLQTIDKLDKEKIVKPIVGTLIRIYNNGVYNYKLILIKNLQGWFDVIKLLSYSKYHENDILSLDISLFEITPNLIEVPEYQSVRYLIPEEHKYLQIILCSKYKISLQDAKNNPSLLLDDQILFTNNEYYLPVTYSLPEYLNDIETFSVSSPPHLPIFANNADDMLTDLCREGWRNKNLNQKLTDPIIKQKYVDRIKEELDVLIKARLSNYMLIIRDIMLYCANNNIRAGLRGSATGCLVSYLIDISDIDPMNPDPVLPYSEERELLFSRFFNVARCDFEKGRFSLADIDLDVEPSFRQSIIDYLKNKYGHDKVAHIITFLRMDGKMAIREVFRVLNPVADSVKVAEDITKSMVDVAKVQDILADLQEDDPKYTIIHYNIDNISKIKDYYYEFQDVFETAIKLSGLIRTTGIHAAGIVVGDIELYKFLPITLDKRDHGLVVALEMADAEYCGAVKYDILGVSAYEKISQIIKAIKHE